MNKRALHKISYGLYVVSSKKDDKLNGQIANTVFQITAEPVRIAISINRDNLTHEYINESKVFAVSVLSTEASMKYIGKFGFKSGREIDKFADTKYHLGETGAPILEEYSLAYLEAKVVDQMDVGTHTIFIGEVIAADITDGDLEPMTYAYYHQVKNGTAPKSAPTYIGKENEEPIKETTSDEPENKEDAEPYRCVVCGYIYDPAEGDPDADIQPGTPFDQLPEDWVCPICGAPKSAFEKVE